MSYKDGIAAINLEMPDRVPRTEYSADRHWELVNAVTGSHVTPNSPAEECQKASSQFIKAWNYDFVWGTVFGSNIFGKYQTNMGHASYASGGVDFKEAEASFIQTPEEVLRFDPWEVYGEKNISELVRELNAIYQQKCENNPDAVSTVGTYVTLVSGVLAIFGWDNLLLALGYDPDGFGEVVNRYQSFIMQYYQALAECDAPVIMMHDDIMWTSGPFVHPDWYRKYVFPNLKKLTEPLREAGKKIMFTSDGNYTQFIDDIADCGINGFIMEPLTDMEYIAEKYGKTHSFIGNADTNVLLRGSKEDIYNEVKRCMDIGKKCPGFFMAVGNHIPSNTPVENALYYNECYEKLSRR